MLAFDAYAPRAHVCQVLARPDGHQPRDWIIFQPFPDGSRKPASTVP
ncbi:hypothetical protein FHT26_000381 [Rhizobacter sp. SG703]|nr:hypothetical protein [Rhizobacter sp. SG703]